MSITQKCGEFKQNLNDKKAYKAFQELFENKDRIELKGRENFSYELNKTRDYCVKSQKFITYALMPILGFASVANGYVAFSGEMPILGAISAAIGALAFAVVGNSFGKAGGIKGIKEETLERKERNKEKFDLAKLYANRVTNHEIFDVPADVYSKEEAEKIRNDLLDAEHER